MAEEVDKSQLQKLYHMTPGPQYLLPSTVGCNNLDVTIKKSPAFSMSARYRHPSQKKDYTPSSIVYNCSGMSRNGQIKIKGGILGAKIEGPSKSITPSSHVYYPDFKANSTHRKAPSSSLGCKRREPKFLKITPGANTYLIPSGIGANVPFLKSSPAYSQLGRSKQRDRSFYVPPPSEYDPVQCDVFKNKTPEFSIKGRKPDTIRPLIPASNSYFPTMYCKQNTPSFCFGVKRKCIVPEFSMDHGDEKIIIQPDDLDPY